MRWESKDLLVGPPLTISPVQVLKEANVTFALAMLPECTSVLLTLLNFTDLPMTVDWHLANLPIEAAAIAKEAGLGEKEVVDLFSSKIDDILGFEGAERNSDFVIWEGNPLEYGANVVLTVDGDNKEIVGCWPEAQ